MSNSDPTNITEVVSDVARLEEKINALADRLRENTEITQENLSQLQDVKTTLRVMETKIHHLQKTDQRHDLLHEKDQDNKREWTREIAIALLAFLIGLLGKWLFGIG